MSGDHNLYQKWRGSEAYAVPMTEEGVKWSQERWRGFNLGYKQAVRDVIVSLMFQHEQVKHRHNSLKVAAIAIEMEFLGEGDE